MHLRGVWARLAGPYPAASVLALSLACAADMAFGPRVKEPGFVLFLAGLVLGLGALQGLIIQGLQAAVKRLPFPIALGYWPLLCLIAGGLLADRLKGFDRLGSRYHMLAVGVLVTCGVGGLLLGGLLALMQPTRRAPLGYLAARPRRQRVALALLLFGGGAAAFYADRALNADLYLEAHYALRIAGLWLALLALVLVHTELRLPQLSSPALALLVAGSGALPVVMLDGHNSRALQEFALRVWPSMVLRTARGMLDVDGDGYAALLAGGDCAPFDPHVHPSAREVPENGVDDNCVLGDARRRVDRIEELPVPKEPSPLDIVLITVDSLRPDHTGVYRPQEYGAAGRGTTPRLDRWAADATVFMHAYTSGGWTSVALPSLLRGLYPRRLQWTNYFETNYIAMIKRPLEAKLRPGEVPLTLYPQAFEDPHPPLAQRLQHRGMYTAAVLDDGYCEIFTRGNGPDIGFDTYMETDRQGRGRRGNKTTVDLALSVLRRIKDDRRFFLWVHMFGVHGPDEFHEGGKIYGDTQTDLYDHEVSGLDPELHRLLSAIDARKAPVAVFITADHGDVLDPPPRNHGYNLSEDVIRVPLIAKVPGWRPARVETLASIVDVVPTILALTRTPVPAGLDGIDLAPLVYSEPTDSRILISETWKYNVDGVKTIDMIAAFDARTKVVFDRMQHQMVLSDKTMRRGNGAVIEGMSTSALTNAIYGYLDETGGEMRLGDWGVTHDLATRRD